MTVGNVRAWVEESFRRRDDIVVVVCNRTTQEEFVTPMSPGFVVSLYDTGEIQKTEVKHGQD